MLLLDLLGNQMHTIAAGYQGPMTYIGVTNVLFPKVWTGFDIYSSGPNVGGTILLLLIIL